MCVHEKRPFQRILINVFYFVKPPFNPIHQEKRSKISKYQSKNCIFKRALESFLKVLAISFTINY